MLRKLILCFALPLCCACFALPAENSVAGTMNVYICPFNAPNVGPNLTTAANNGSNITTRTGNIFDFTTNTDDGWYGNDIGISPVESATSGDLFDQRVTNERYIVQDYCNDRLPTDNGRTGNSPDKRWLAYYGGPGFRTTPQGSCVSLGNDMPCTNGTADAWKHKYGVPANYWALRRATAAGSSKITYIKDLAGTAIVAGEGWETLMLANSGGSWNTGNGTKTLDHALACRPGFVSYGSTPMNPSEFRHDDWKDSNNDGEPDAPTSWGREAYYQCMTYFYKKSGTNDATSLIYVCDSRIFEDGTVKCADWSVRNKTVTGGSSISLGDATQVQARMDCQSTWRETGDTNTCYTGSVHNRICDETALTATYFGASAYAHSCSWNAGLWLGGTSASNPDNNSSTYFVVSESAKPSITATNDDNGAKKCSGWFSVACSGSNFNAQFAITASDALGIAKSAVGVNLSSGLTEALVSSAQSGWLSGLNSGSSDPIQGANTSVCADGVTSGIQSCYQPCSRQIEGSGQGTTVADSYGAMRPCIGDGTTSTLSMQHQIPVFSNGALQSNFKEGTNSLSFAVADPTQNITISSGTPSQLQVKIDLTDPATSPTSACVSSSGSTAAPTVSDSGKTGSAEGYWSPTVKQNITLSASACDSASGTQTVKILYEISSDGGSTWGSKTAAGDGGSKLSAECSKTSATPAPNSVVSIASNDGCVFNTQGMTTGTKIRFRTWARDAALNDIESTTTAVITIDNTAPEPSALSLSKSADGDTWAALPEDSGNNKSWTNTKHVKVTWGAMTDPGGSGVDKVKFVFTPGSCAATNSDWNSASDAGGQEFSQDRSQSCRQGQHTFKMYAKDGAGNESSEATAKSISYHYDSDPTPESLGASPLWADASGLKPANLVVSPSGQSATNSFAVTWANPSPNGTTESPVSKVWYRIGNGEAQSEDVSSVCIGTGCSLNGLTVPSGGSHPIRIWLQDQAGNSDLGQSVSGVLNWGGGDCP